MPRTTPIRWATTLALCASPCLPAQLATAPHGKPSAAVPYTAPTLPPETPAPAAPQTPAQRPPRHAEVTFAQGQLAVVADNASLNQILREIGRTTGIKISGGVAEERVFGKYGPSPTQDVLTALLDGTSSNLLLVQGEPGKPTELILTPRHGGPTPPNPNAPGFDDGGGDTEDQMQPQRVFQPPPQQPQGQAGPGPGGASPSGAGAQSASPTTDATDPNAVKTPQQIYEQLQRMRQQQTPPPQ